MPQQITSFTLPNVATRPRHSLFWRVLTLVLVTAVLAALAMAVYFQYILRDTYDRFLKEQIGSYMRMVSDNIGSPPDTGRARQMTEHYPIDIRIEQNSDVWSSLDGVSTVAAIRRETLPTQYDRGDSLLFRSYKDRLYGVVVRDGWTSVIRLRSQPAEGSVMPATVVLGLVLVLLFISAWFVVQRYLRPVRELLVGVQAVASENFDHKVPVISHDELGQLTRSFNAMSQRVAAIIASKRRLLFDVSHELRSPLTRMNVALVMLPDGKAKISIERNIRELNTMITELLENERLAVLGGTLIVEKLDVVAMVRKVIETFGYDERRIEFDTLTESLEITADTQRLTVAVRNLISNALKYSADTEGLVRIKVFPDDNGARIIVADEGIGIPAEQQARVFEPFYRTDDSRSRATGGYGLGLSLTRSIVEAHGGTIQLTSIPGKGTTIVIWFPASPTSGSVTRTVGSGSNRETITTATSATAPVTISPSSTSSKGESNDS